MLNQKECQDNAQIFGKGIEAKHNEYLQNLCCL